jgi:hypothetical protein
LARLLLLLMSFFRDFLVDDGLNKGSSLDRLRLRLFLLIVRRLFDVFRSCLLRHMNLLVMSWSYIEGVGLLRLILFLVLVEL